MDAAGLQACWDLLPPDKQTTEAIDRRLARQAVQSGRLTLWQAQQLVAGRSTGFKIDRYVLLDLIGQGGMGRVYLAQDTRLNRRVAIKILSPERVNNPRAILRFRREAMVGAQLQHENLVRIYDEGEANGRCYLVMEYIEGRNIGQIIAANGPIEPAVAARLTRQVALGLEHAQRKGLIHRDVNPYNILVTRDGVAKLTDMGLAIDLADNDHVTRDGATVGTFDYVSPEQARHSHDVDSRSDMYSLGCSLYHMLTGQVPFPSPSLPEKLFAHQASEPEPLSRAAPAVPPGLAAVVARMMRKKPADRYASPLDLAVALEPFTDEAASPDGDNTPSLKALAEAAAAIKAKDAAAAAEAARSATPSSATPAPPESFPSASTASNLDNMRPAPAAAHATINGTVVAPPPPPPVSPPTPPRPVPAAKPVSTALNLGLDLGPEAPLISSRDRPKPRPSESKSDAKPADPGAGPRTKPKPKPWANQSSAVAGWLVPVAAAAGLVVVGGGGLLAYQSLFGAWSTVRVDPRPPAPGKGVRAADSNATKPGSGSLPAVPAVMPKGKEVAVVAADGTTAIEPDFASALRAAIGAKGHVLLLNREPLVLTAAEAGKVSGGPLTIRGGAGRRPVLRVEVKGGRPFLSTGSDTPLRIEGVTIEATFVEPGAAPAPVIEAGADMVIDRCVFRVDGATGPIAGTRAVMAEGRSLVVRGCWFENFGQALDVALFAGGRFEAAHCQFVGSRPVANPAPASSPAGWAARLRASPGGFGKTGRKLSLDHCTSLGGGLLEFEGFSGRLPVTVDLKSCAVLASDALIAWQPPKDLVVGPFPGKDALSWLGQNDQFDIHGPSWLRLTPAAAGPTDLESWNKLVGTERDPVPPPVRFTTDPSSLSEHPTPQDFTLADPGASHSVGADPKRVGPGALPVDPRGT